MFDRERYQTACAHLSLSQEKLEEMITMTENIRDKKHLSRPLRATLIAAACVAALTITAMAAPAVQQLITTYTITYRSSNSTTAFTLPTLALEEREGRSILSVNGLETDVTDAFAKDGQYVANVDGAHLTVTPDGWVTVTMDTDEDSDLTYTFNLNAGDAVSSIGSVRVSPSSLGETDVGVYDITTDESGAVVVAEYLPE